MNRRRFVGASGALLLAGCSDVLLRDGVSNECLGALPAALRDHPLVQAAWEGIDPAAVIDSHVHLVGIGDTGPDTWINPEMDEIWHPTRYLQRLFYLNATCIGDRRPVDDAVVQRLVEQCREMRPGFRTLLLAFDWARDAHGAIDRSASTFRVSDAYAARTAARHPDLFEWAASIHPLDPAALARLDAGSAMGMRAVKWLPSAQLIDPADPRCDPFYARLAQLRIPLISHGGDERAVHSEREELDNPLRLRRALDAGVRVVIAHCASLGQGKDLDAPGTPLRDNFELFARLMDEPRYRANLVGDVSAITQLNRIDVCAKILARSDWADRLLNGSDFPLAGVVPIVSLPALVEHGLLPTDAVPTLHALRNHNVLLFDFVLKRSLTHDGKRFGKAVFETRRWFEGR
ncbi:MAG: hypothetical protein IT516_06430 [Burkholderiales bacterium]|nr:hypothetical protein [Burkholderiales bacterium]